MRRDDHPLTGRCTLVTGASGFLGSRLAERLLGAGARVHGVRRAPTGVPAARGIRWHDMDLAESGAVGRLVRAVRPDVVFHLASLVTGAREAELVAPMLRTNLISAVELLSAAAETKSCRLVLAGSMEEPGPGEDRPVSSPYALAKWAASEYARMFHHHWDVPVTVLRIAMAYGPGQRDVTKLIPHTTLSFLTNRPPQLTSGSRDIDWVYVDDVVEALIAGAVAPEAVGQVIPIGSGSPVSIRETVQLLHELVGPSPAPHFGALADRPRESARIADPSVAAALLGWAPHVDLREGLTRTVAWYRERHSLGEFTA